MVGAEVEAEVQAWAEVEVETAGVGEGVVASDWIGSGADVSQAARGTVVEGAASYESAQYPSQAAVEQGLKDTLARMFDVTSVRWTILSMTQEPSGGRRSLRRSLLAADTRVAYTATLAAPNIAYSTAEGTERVVSMSELRQGLLERGLGESEPCDDGMCVEAAGAAVAPHSGRCGNGVCEVAEAGGSCESDCPTSTMQ
eukprot:gene31211-39185_t